MSEEVLGIVRVSRVSYTDPLPRIYETLYFTPDRTVVARTSIVQKEGIFLGVIAAVVAAVGGFYVGPTIFYPPGITPRFEQLARFGVGLMFAGIFLLIPAAIFMIIVGATSKKKEKEYSELPLENILKAHKHNYTIPNSEIIEVELKKSGKGIKLNIKTSKKYGETKWSVRETWKDVGEKYENILRPIFKNRLTEKK